LGVVLACEETGLHCPAGHCRIARTQIHRIVILSGYLSRIHSTPYLWSRPSGAIESTLLIPDHNLLNLGVAGNFVRAKRVQYIVRHCSSPEYILHERGLIWLVAEHAVRSQ
jgi:hypothetical protein